MYVPVMLLEKAENNLPFDDNDWITELKLDGIRVLLSRFNGVTKLYTRHKNEITSKFKEIASLPLPNNIVLDGELIVTDKWGKPDFELMLSRFQSSKTGHEASFVVFDVLYYQGEKIVHFPLVERKRILEKLLPDEHSNITKIQWSFGNGVSYFELIKQHRLEGQVQKLADSVYQIGSQGRSIRSKNWLVCCKIKVQTSAKNLYRVQHYFCAKKKTCQPPQVPLLF